MKKATSLTELRNTLKGRIYIYLDSEETCKRFLQAAENEGYRFGKIKPTHNSYSDVIALEKNKQLSYVGFAGHVAFHNPSFVSEPFHRVDYRKFVTGEKNYFCGNKE